GLAMGAVAAWWWLAHGDSGMRTEVEPLPARPEPVARATTAPGPSPPELAGAPAPAVPDLERVDLTSSLPVLPAEETRCFVTGAVVDRTGSPVQAFSISIPSPENETSGTRLRGSGTYALRVPGPGVFELVCQAEGFMTQKRSVVVARGSS